MKLAKYLADYIRYEQEDRVDDNVNSKDMEEVIQQGLEAFASSEDKIISITLSDGCTLKELFV